MKMLILLTSFLWHPVCFGDAPSLHQVRVLYQQAATSKDAAKKLAGLLDTIDSAKVPPVLLCYKGVAVMMQAQYVISPVSKFDKFKKGRVLIEEAIRRDTAGIEMRYLRFAVQTNLPSFLGYHDQIGPDKLFLLKNYRGIKDEEFKKMAWQYLSASKYCTEEERKQLIN